ncbi:MAG: hypothetical protein JST22_20720 [Bacteroidetes bacterium]|nr:hypothetical protein [Bacteroidota bacterium]
MNLHIILQFATLLSVVIGFASLLNSLHAQRRQANAQIFLAYTKRFDEIMSDFREEEFQAHLDTVAPAGEIPSELRNVAGRYLNLCCEEYFLCSAGYLAKKIWRAWEPDIIRALRRPLYRTLWPHLRNEYQSYNNEFVAYVEAVQAGHHARKWRRTRTTRPRSEPGTTEQTAI